ncbi:hypothetical protein [Flavobacterium yafengii]|uniref:Lipoprotein n=1 Tax=Flavobacterium yafengii TaxID=3041253 RepID=A0AAW6TKT8_9FLAO|nr:hypothetical protein [Flavobacterium yafengii]MDI5949469.1 hypothetical protein [Flavobacterium yafengii]
MNKTVENTLFKSLIILSIFITLQSCKERKNTILDESEKSDLTKTFEYKLKHEPKIFLKYWSGMSVDESSKVDDILIADGSIAFDRGTYTYELDNYSITMKFNFNTNNKLESITLKSDIDKIYSLYQKKYNLPDLVDTNLLYQCYLDNNADYQPVLTYKKIGDGGKLSQVPAVLLDKTPPLKSRIYFDINDEEYNSTYYTKKFYKDEFTVDKDSVFIVFQQTLKDIANPSVTWSLEKNKEAMSAQQNINGEGFGTINYPESGITGHIIASNSRIKTVYKYYVLEQSITYFSKNEYNKRKNIIDNNIKKDSLKRQTEEDRQKERKEKSINEI